MKLVSSRTTTTSFHQHLCSPLFSSSFPKRRRRFIKVASCMYSTTAAAAAASTISSPSCGQQRKNEKVVVIMGATGTGKSKLSIDLATRFSPAEIINSDKMQVYEGLDITTNKMPLNERRGVQHHFLGDFDTDEHGELSPTEFRRLVESTVSDIISRKTTPFLVGGSNSFVYSSLVEDYDPDSDVFNGSVGSESVKSELRYDCCFLWVDSSLPVLYEYLDKRVDDMLDLGMVDELAEFFSDSCELVRDLDKATGLRKAIGVPEFQRYFREYPPRKQKGMDNRVRRGAYEEVVMKIKENTRQLAKRQIDKIIKLTEGGWDLHRLDATATFQLLLLDSDKWRGVWEEQVLEPSVKIVKRFLWE